MKIVCDACQAKYSISDDKVQGKVFKIRCKKCSNIIVVRGGAAEPAPAPQQEKDTRVYDYGYEGGDHAPAGDDAVWHVVINQDQVGPMTAIEVQQRFASGEIDSETYIWREGFADWSPLAQVEAFAQLAASGAPSGSSGSSGAHAVAAMFGGGEDAGAPRNDPGDLFAAASSSSARHDDDGDLFGGKPAAASSGQSGTKLRGERNENSVLFSLNNLAQLASDKPAPAAHAPAASSSLGGATGQAGGEGSGLIDIRSMASAYLGGPAGAAKPASAGIGSIDDLPVFGGGGFSEPAVIVPITPRQNNNKLMYALIGSVGLLAVAAVVVVVVLLKGGDSKPAQVAQVEPATDKVGETRPPEAAPAETKPPETKPAEAAAATPKDEAPADPGSSAQPPRNPEDTRAGDPPSDSRRSSSTGRKPTTASAQPRPPKADRVEAPTPKPPTPAKDSGGGGSCDEVSCVLNNYEGACCSKFRKGGGGGGGGGRASGSRGDLPESLDRAMISEGVGKVKPRVMSCGERSPAKGQVKVSVKVAPDGRVTNVTVKNTPDASLGNCVASMMQKATFAKTQTGGSFAYPYTF
jgi:predicted Zn finger-like uncharacterized protein